MIGLYRDGFRYDYARSGYNFVYVEDILITRHNYRRVLSKRLGFEDLPVVYGSSNWLGLGDYGFLYKLVQGRRYYVESVYFKPYTITVDTSSLSFSGSRCSCLLRIGSRYFRVKDLFRYYHYLSHQFDVSSYLFVRDLLYSWDKGSKKKKDIISLYKEDLLLGRSSLSFYDWLLCGGYMVLEETLVRYPLFCSDNIVLNWEGFSFGYGFDYSGFCVEWERLLRCYRLLDIPEGFDSRWLLKYIERLNIGVLKDYVCRKGRYYRCYFHRREDCPKEYEPFLREVKVEWFHSLYEKRKLKCFVLEGLDLKKWGGLDLKKWEGLDLKKG
jgi:hypothetical protein